MTSQFTVQPLAGMGEHREAMAPSPDTAQERGSPSSPDAERSILGAILLENAHFHEAAEKKLTADDFSLDSHRRIFARMEDLIGGGRAGDLVTLVQELARRKEVESVGGVAYLASLTEGLPRRVSIEEYVRIVKDKSLLRQLIHVCNQAITQAVDKTEDLPAALTSAERALLA